MAAGPQNSTHHESLVSELEIRASSDRALGFVLAAFFLVVALAPLLHRAAVRGWALAASLVLVAIAFLAPGLLHPVNLVWTRLAILLHRIVSPIVMALLFFFGFALTGFVLRALGKDLLRLRPASGSNSYWITRNPPGPPPESMARQF